MAGLNKTLNPFVTALDAKLYDQCPKAVFAAVAVSALTTGGDRLEAATAEIVNEWWILYDNGIVTQKPPFARPADPTEGPSR